MRLLLDTHVLLWWLADRELTSHAKAIIADPSNDVAVSAVTAWEISIKKAFGKLKAPNDLSEQVAASNFAALDITIAHATAAGELPAHHDDPFDRMLIAQAGLEGLMLVTRDSRFDAYGVPILAV